MPEAPDGYVVQVHFAGKPGTSKRIMNSQRREIHDYLDALKKNGTLLASGRYLSSVGGMWLLKVKTLSDAEKIARGYPPVKKEMLTFRLNILMDTEGELLNKTLPEKNSALVSA
ncbi:MAG: hypothetical protein H6505_02915 [Calditrichaeota bacterium]|nr:hypothetical protein [Calditrichota bacterium]